MAAAARFATPVVTIGDGAGSDEADIGDAFGQLAAGHLREEVTRVYADEPYWGKVGPGLRDFAARILVLGVAPAPTAPAACSTR